MNIAIVEDDIKQQEILSDYISKYFHKENRAFEVTRFSDGMQIIDLYKGDYDIIYLDIEMEFMDGMTTAKKIRELDSEVLIVFVTNHVQFAIDGYAVNASDFLLKPLTYFNFSEHFKKTLKKIDDAVRKSISIKTTNGMRRIYIDELYYVESEGHNIHLHTAENSYSIWDSMKNMESLLSEYYFYRCNNCYLVNLKYVQGIADDQVLINNEHLKISRPRKKDFLNALTNYLGEE